VKENPETHPLKTRVGHPAWWQETTVNERDLGKQLRTGGLGLGLVFVVDGTANAGKQLRRDVGQVVGGPGVLSGLHQHFGF